MKTILKSKNKYIKWSIIAVILLVPGFIIGAIAFPFFAHNNFGNHLLVNPVAQKLLLKLTGQHWDVNGGVWLIDAQTMSGETVISRAQSESIQNLTLYFTTIEVQVKDAPDGQFRIVPNREGYQYRYEIDSDNATLTIQTDPNDKEITVFNDDYRSITIYIPKDIPYEKIIIASGMSSVKIDSLSASGIELKAGMGEMKINELSALELITDVGMGSIDFQNAFVQNADLSVGMGEMDYKGEISGNLTLEVGMGSADIKLAGSRDMHKIYTKIGLGEVSINDKFDNNWAIGSHESEWEGSERNGRHERYFDGDIDEKGEFHERGFNEYDSVYEINCGLGSVKVKFLE